MAIRDLSPTTTQAPKDHSVSQREGDTQNSLSEETFKGIKPTIQIVILPNLELYSEK